MQLQQSSPVAMAPTPELQSPGSAIAVYTIHPSWMVIHWKYELPHGEEANQARKQPGSSD